ncbi:hypothetical protein [Stenotrophomonas sp. SrG]|uniref:hypothetical protein n=1 Tax=Stenotrophomonas sp. SrG TaxID=3414430 RepID=UPI003CF05863
MTAFALAVIDAQIADCRASGDTGNVENLVEARAAIAGLVEADAAYHDLMGRMRQYPSTMLDSALRKAERRAASALARVQGGAA